MTLVGGRFDLSTEVHGAPSTITPVDAVTQAQAYLETFGKYFLDQYMDVYGSEFTLQELEPDRRVVLARSRYGDDVDLPIRALKKAIGSYFLVTFLSDATPAVRVAVSVHNGDVIVNGDGRLELPVDNGGEFFAVGIPPGASDLPSAEQAALHAAVQTGALVAGAPVLWRDRFPGLAPTYGYWEIPLGNVVVLQNGMGEDISARSVFVGLRERIYVSTNVRLPSQTWHVAERFGIPGNEVDLPASKENFPGVLVRVSPR